MTAAAYREDLRAVVEELIYEGSITPSLGASGEWGKLNGKLAALRWVPPAVGSPADEDLGEDVGPKPEPLTIAARGPLRSRPTLTQEA